MQRRTRAISGLRWPSAILTTGLVLASCGTDVSGDAATTPEAPAPTAGASTEDTEKDTEKTEAGAAPAAAPESLEPLRADSSRGEIVATVAGVQGPTADASAQMNRLTPYPEIPTPTQAMITNLEVNVRRADDATMQVASKLDLSVAGNTDDLVIFYETSLPSLGWTQTSVTTESRTVGLAGDEAPVVVLVFQQPSPDESGEGPKLTVRIVDEPRRTRRIVETEYDAIVDADEIYLTRFAAWFEEGVVPTLGREMTNAVVIATPRDGRTRLQLSTTFEFVESSQEELIEALTAWADRSSLEFADRFGAATIDATSYNTAFQSYNFVVEDNPLDEGARVNVNGLTNFNTEFLDFGARVEPASTEPLPAEPHWIDLINAISDIEGTSDDVAGQLNRLVPFPQVPSPDGASISAVNVAVRPKVEDEMYISSSTRFDMPGLKKDAVVFFESNLAPLVWTETSRTDEVTETGAEQVSIEYDLPDQGDTSRATFVLTLSAEQDRNYTTVIWTYSAYKPVDAAFEKQWIAWASDGPIPGGGTLEDVSLEHDFLSGDDQVVLIANYAGYEADVDAVQDDVRSLIRDSDFTVDDTGIALEGSMRLDHPDLNSALVSARDSIDGGTAVSLFYWTANVSPGTVFWLE